MKKRTSSLPILVLVAVVALVLGSFGTATAAGLTAGKVKKIATKVVNKKAPSLSVAHATTATTASNATALNGQPASAYQDNSTVYSITKTVTSTSSTITIPLAAGNYNVGYSAYLSGGSGYSGCYIYKAAGATTNLLTADDESSSTSSPAFSAVGFLPVAAGETVKLYCFSATTWVTFTNEPIQIIVTPVDTVTSGTLTAAKGSAARN
jgi:hypothetical protein